MKNEKLTISAIIINIILFIIKLFAGIYSGSLAVISDAFNSFTDIISSSFIHVAVKVANKKADQDHPFGHDRAEPIAAFISAIFAGILAFELVKNALFSTDKAIHFGLYTCIVLVVTMVTKSIMAYLFHKKNTPAMRALSVDSRNDVLTSLIALIGVISSFYGYVYMDRLSAIIISLFIFYTAYRIGVENIDYLMGKSATDEFIKKIKEIALSVDGIKGINELNAHYVGNRIHVEIHIEVNKNINTKKSHDIGKKVQRGIEELPDVCRAFIHIDPI